MEPIVLQLQSDCLTSQIPISTLLRKAKLIASKLNLSDFEALLESELNGYNCALKDLPEYRKGLGSPKMFNPFHGWQNIVIGDSRLDRIISECHLNHGVSEIEHMISNHTNGFVILGFNNAVRDFLHQKLNIEFQCGLYVSTSVLVAVLEGVKNSVLDWTLNLEKNGIVGEGMSFSKSDIERAQTVTNHFYNSNVGVVGSVSGDAINSHFYTETGEVNQQNVTRLVSQIREAAPGLPPAIATAIESPIANLEDGAKVGDKPRIAAAFHALRSILEGASGNLVASGILAALGAS